MVDRRSIWLNENPRRSGCPQPIAHWLQVYRKFWTFLLRPFHRSHGLFAVCVWAEELNICTEGNFLIFLLTQLNITTYISLALLWTTSVQFDRYLTSHSSTVACRSTYRCGDTLSKKTLCLHDSLIYRDWINRTIIRVATRIVSSRGLVCEFKRKKMKFKVYWKERCACVAFEFWVKCKLPVVFVVCFLSTLSTNRRHFYFVTYYR